MIMIEVANLTKRFGNTIAIDGVSFTVGRGEIVGLLGPNGAGKTSTMRILACFLSATGGDARVAGLDVFSDPLGVRRKIGYLPEDVPLYGEMRVSEYLRFRGSLKGLRRRKLSERVDDVVGTCGLTEVRERVIRQLSKGFKQRVGLADSLIHEPELLILDEPTIGLDPNQICDIRELIRGLAREHTVLLSSHILSEVEMICRRVLIMNEGRIVASDSPENLAGLMQGNTRVVAELCGSRREILRTFEETPRILKVSCTPLGQWSRVVCECRNGTDIREQVFELVCRNEWRLRELSIQKPRLEDVFLAITRGGAEGSAER